MVWTENLRILLHGGGRGVYLRQQLTDCELLMKVQRMSREHRATRHSRPFVILLIHLVELAE